MEMTDYFNCVCAMCIEEYINKCTAEENKSRENIR